MRSTTRLGLPVLALLPLLLAGPGRAADGDLDPGFNAGAPLVYSESAAMSFTKAILAPDGAAVVFGSYSDAGGSALHWRRISDAGAGPLCAHAFSGASALVPGGATFDSDGRLLLALSLELDGEPDRRLIAMRVAYPSCALDASFGFGGFALPPLALAGFANPYAAGVVTVRWFTMPPLAIERIFLLFRMSGSGGVTSFLYRLRPDGSPDPVFGGGDGISIAGSEQIGRALARTFDGRLLVGGSTSDAFFDGDFYVQRFDHDGVLDASFGDAGLAQIQPLPGISSDESLFDMAIAGDGRIVLVGSSDGFPPAAESGLVVVLDVAGELDASVSGDGVVPFAVASSVWTRGRGVAVQTDGKIVVAGSFEDPSEPGDDEGFVLRFDRSGTLDASFAVGGVRSFAFDAIAGGEDGASSVLVRADGRLWSVGWSEQGSNNHYQPWVARLTNALLFADGFERGSTGAW